MASPEIGVPTTDHTPDGQAESEGHSTVQRDYASQSLWDTYKRKRALLDITAQTGQILLWVLQISIVFIGVTLALHYVLPSAWLWISEDRLDKIEALLAGGLLTGVGVFAREYLKSRS